MTTTANPDGHPEANDPYAVGPPASGGGWRRFAFLAGVALLMVSQLAPLALSAIGHWLSDVNRERPRSVEYLDSTVGEVRDPTGCQAPVWDQVVDEIGRLAGQSCALLS